jgi:hypothetical protein
LKQYGDAIRNMVSKMSENSSHEFISFITKFDQVFETLGVPNELRVALLTPYLSEKCRTLINQLTGEDASSYEVVKQYLMNQLRLVPSYFVDQFNRIVRGVNETYKGYMSRLAMLLRYYLKSRNVTDFETLFQLLVCDKVKASLSENVLSHVLRNEVILPDQWADVNELADILDTYCANYDRCDKPKASALGQCLTFHEEVSTI